MLALSLIVLSLRHKGYCLRYPSHCPALSQAGTPSGGASLNRRRSILVFRDAAVPMIRHGQRLVFRSQRPLIPFSSWYGINLIFCSRFTFPGALTARKRFGTHPLGISKPPLGLLLWGILFAVLSSSYHGIPYVGLTTVLIRLERIKSTRGMAILDVFLSLLATCLREGFRFQGTVGLIRMSSETQRAIRPPTGLSDRWSLRFLDREANSSKEGNYA